MMQVYMHVVYYHVCYAKYNTLVWLDRLCQKTE